MNLWNRCCIRLGGLWVWQRQADGRRRSDHGDCVRDHYTMEHCDERLSVQLHRDRGHWLWEWRDCGQSLVIWVRFTLQSDVEFFIAGGWCNDLRHHGDPQGLQYPQSARLQCHPGEPGQGELLHGSRRPFEAWRAWHGPKQAPAGQRCRQPDINGPTHNINNNIDNCIYIIINISIHWLLEYNWKWRINVVPIYRKRGE